MVIFTYRQFLRESKQINKHNSATHFNLQPPRTTYVPPWHWEWNHPELLNYHTWSLIDVRAGP